MVGPLSRWVAASVVAFAVVAFGQDVPKLQKLSEHVYAYVGITHAAPATGFGANSGVVVGRDAVLVIDTQVSAKLGERLLQDIHSITDKPVKYVVNTHYHLDHAWGNCVFARQGAVIIAHEQSRQATGRSEYGLAHVQEYGLTKADVEGTTIVAPTITFTKDMLIDLGDVTVELNFPGASHTSGSITAYVPQDKVLFTGDILFTAYHPFLGEGDLVSWQQVLTDLESTPAEKIVPGHGPVSSVKDLRDMKQYIRIFDAAAKELCAGKKPADIPAIARELAKRLPEQPRELPGMLEMNLATKYLPSPDAAK